MQKSMHPKSGDGVLFSQRLRRKGWQGLLLVVLIATPLSGQTPSSTHLEVIALPPNTGAPITIVPTARTSNARFRNGMALARNLTLSFYVRRKVSMLRCAFISSCPG